MSRRATERDLGELCRAIDEVLQLLNTLGSSREYLDKNLVPTSEGMKILRRAVRIARENRLPCIEVIEKISQGYHRLHELYECISSALQECSMT